MSGAAWQYVGRRGWLDAGEHGPLVRGAVRGATGRAWPQSSRRMWAVDYSAARTGVRQGHADYCADFGHAYAVSDRELSTRCGRCLADLDAATLAGFRAELLARDAIDLPTPEPVEAAGVQLGMVLVAGIDAAYAAAPGELGAATSEHGGSHAALVSAGPAVAALRERTRAAGSASGLLADLACGGVWFGWLDPLAGIVEACELLAGTEYGGPIAGDAAASVADAIWAAAGVACLDGVDTGGEVVHWIARGDRRVLDYLPRSVAREVARELGAALAAALWHLATSGAARRAVLS